MATLAGRCRGMLRHNTTRRRFAEVVGLGGLAVGASGVASARPPARNFRAHLAGGNEVPPVETNAQG